jgi:hypothetical protein
MNIHGGYLIDMDISKYFDTIPHEKHREILGRRVSDGVIQRVIGKWLNAGVMEAGNVACQEQGTPQGGVISPILSNSYLHEVLDGWLVKEVRPRLKGKAFMVRYADDAVIGCEQAEDAERIMKVLALRFAKYGLTIHPEKTKLIDFTEPGDGAGKGKGSFTFLGFTHYWMKSKKGKWVVGRKTDKKVAQVDTGGNPMVPEEPGQEQGGAAPRTDREAQGTLRILWHNDELQKP